MVKISSAVEIDGDFLTVEVEAATYEEARDKLDALVPEGGKLIGIIVADD